MLWRTCIALALTLIPLSVHAAAGFPTGAIWLSDNAPALGAHVRIYAVIYNGTNEKADGTVTFLVDEKTHESKPLVLKPGESTVVSSLWTAAEGAHAFAARYSLRNADESSAQTSASVQASVAAPPSKAAEAVVQAKEVSSKIASTSLPLVSSVGKKIFDTTEALRTAGLSALEKDDVTPSQSSTSAAEASAPSEDAGLVSEILGYIRAVLAMVFRSLWLFYPILILILLFLLRILFRWATGPRF